MCAFFNLYNYPFKWITYLVFTISVYTFIHWFLAIPLLYSHFIECCVEHWSKNWLVWFLLISFACWLCICILVLLTWCCLRACCERRSHEPSVRFANEDKKPDLERNSLEKENNVEKKPTEILSLPEFNSRGSFTIIQMNDVQERKEDKLVSGSDFPIPLDESCHFVQNEPVEERKDEEKPPKTPREIFFKDLIEAASASQNYFDFDPEKVADSILEKSNAEDKVGQNIYFVGGPTEKENLKSEVFVKLNEKGLIEEPPVPLGQFQILKD